MNLNRVIVAGRLTRDVDLSYTPSGKASAKFSLAINKTWYDKDTKQKQESTEYVNVQVWGKTAELCNQYLSKGRQCLVEGELKTDSWEKDGEKKYKTYVLGRSVQFIGGKSENFEKPKSSSDRLKEAEKVFDKPVTSFTDDDIPF